MKPDISALYRVSRSGLAGVGGTKTTTPAFKLGVPVDGGHAVDNRKVIYGHSLNWVRRSSHISEFLLLYRQLASEEGNKSIETYLNGLINVSKGLERLAERTVLQEISPGSSAPVPENRKEHLTKNKLKILWLTSSW